MKRLYTISAPSIRTMCLVILALVLCWTSESTAKPYGSFHRGVRPLGMGGAFTAVADDENALFYNPAGLSSMNHLKLGLVNPLVEISDNTIDLKDDLDDIDTDNSDEVAELLRKHVGNHQHARVSLFPYAGFQLAKAGVMVGGLVQAEADADIRNPVYPEAHIDYIQDVALMAGAGLGVPLTGLRVGATLKGIRRESLSEVYTADDIADENFDDRFDDDLVSGSGVGLDIGAIYTLPFIDFVKTDVALAIQNIPQLDLGDAVDMKTQANFGLAIEKSLAKFKLIGAMDYLDLTNNVGEDSDFAKHLHFGVELQTPLFFSVRAGINQGYFTAGATVDFRFLRLDFAAYTEEVGAYAGQRDDQRYVAQISFGW